MPEAQEKITKNETAPDNKQAEITSEATTEAAINEPADVTPIGPAAHRTKSDSKGGAATFLAFTALVVALGAFGAGYMAWQQIGGEQNNLSTVIDQTEKNIASLQSTAETNKSVAAAVKQTNELLQNRLENLESQLNNSVGKLQGSDSQLNEAITNLSEKLSASRSDDWLVAEARHMINIAQQQAQLNNNVAAAVAALEAADKRLRDAADPTLLTVRQAVTDDIVALRSVGEVDISGMAMTLSTLEQGVEQLPLKNKERGETTTENGNSEAATEVSDIGSFFSKIWDDIKNLISIRRTSEEQTNVALLPPGQKFFLQQNLRLKLETARLALLQRDTQTFHDSLATATNWLETYFDKEATSTANLLTNLSTYQEVNLQPALPDISRALRALDDWRNKQSNKAGQEVSAP